MVFYIHQAIFWPYANGTVDEMAAKMDEKAE